MDIIGFFKSLNWRLRYAILAFVGSSVYAWGVITYANAISAMPVMQQFLFITLPIYAVLAWMMSKAAGNGWMTWLGFALMMMLPSFIVPPYMVNLDGSIATALLVGTSLEVNIASLLAAQGFSGLTLWALVYPVSFTILVVVAAQLLSKRQFEGSVL